MEPVTAKGAKLPVGANAGAAKPFPISRTSVNGGSEGSAFDMSGLNPVPEVFPIPKPSLSPYVQTRCLRLLLLISPHQPGVTTLNYGGCTT
jgi:hypothetical protein